MITSLRQCGCGDGLFRHNALVSINKVTLRRDWLVLGWLTVCLQINHVSM